MGSRWRAADTAAARCATRGPAGSASRRSSRSVPAGRERSAFRAGRRSRWRATTRPTQCRFCCPARRRAARSRRPAQARKARSLRSLRCRNPAKALSNLPLFLLFLRLDAGCGSLRRACLSRCSRFCCVFSSPTGLFVQQTHTHNININAIIFARWKHTTSTYAYRPNRFRGSSGRSSCRSGTRRRHGRFARAVCRVRTTSSHSRRSST